MPVIGSRVELLSDAWMRPAGQRPFIRPEAAAWLVLERRGRILEGSEQDGLDPLTIARMLDAGQIAPSPSLSARRRALP